MSGKHVRISVQKDEIETLKARILMYKRIADEASGACHIPGNINGPDLDEFEQKYHLSSFA